MTTAMGEEMEAGISVLANRPLKMCDTVGSPSQPIPNAVTVIPN